MFAGRQRVNLEIAGGWTTPEAGTGYAPGTEWRSEPDSCRRRPTMEKALAAWLVLAAASPASMVSPTDVIKVAVEQVARVAEDADLGRPVAAERRRLEIRRIADNLFDFQEMARRSLARHWTGRTAEQREEFLRLFTDLLERVYFGKLENYSADRMVYVGETVDGDYATVRSKVVLGKKGELPIENRVHLVDSRWGGYDVLIEG